MEDQTSTGTERNVAEETLDDSATTTQQRGGAPDVVEPETLKAPDIQPSEKESSALSPSAELGTSIEDKQSTPDFEDHEKHSSDANETDAEPTEVHRSTRVVSATEPSDSNGAIVTTCSTAEDSNDKDNATSGTKLVSSPDEEAGRSDSSEAESSTSSSSSSSEEDPDDVIAGAPLPSNSDVAPEVSLNTNGAPGAGQVRDKLAEFTPSEAAVENDNAEGRLPLLTDSLEEFYSKDTSSDDDKDDNELSLSLRAPSHTTGKAPSDAPKSAESTRKISKKLRNSNDRSKKKKRKNDKKEDKKEGKKEVSPPLSTAQVGMIRYSAMASEHIGEMRNPRIGELPSRTAAIPTQPTRYNPKPAVDAAVAAAASLPRLFQSSSGYWGFSGHDDNESEYETDTDAEDSADGAGDAAQKPEPDKVNRVLDENETFFGLVTTGLDTVLEPVGGLGKIKSALPSGLIRDTPAEQKYDDVEDGPCEDSDQSKGGGADDLKEPSASTEGLRSRNSDNGIPKKPKKMRRKKRPLPPDPTRPLDEIEAIKIYFITFVSFKVELTFYVFFFAC